MENSELCPRYMARMVKNIVIKDSPAWMQERLIKAGVRPKNNIVDITNFVMLELANLCTPLTIGTWKVKNHCEMQNPEKNFDSR